MKKYFIPLVAILLITAISCKKDCNTLPPPAPGSLDDARTVLLKDVVLERLPSPYFHFIYDNQEIYFANRLCLRFAYLQCGV